MDQSEAELDVIAVGAHPDDVEIACGGTLALLVRQGYKVGIIDLTDGEPTPYSPGPEVRAKEAQAAARALGVHWRLTLDLPNRRLFDSWEARVQLATELRRRRPQLVIGLAGATPTASPDHWQAMQIIDGAVFYARLTKWDDKFSGLPPHTIRAQLFCSLAWPLEELARDPRRLLINISDTLTAKLAAVRCYASQFPPEKHHILERMEIGARFLGMTAGITAAELLLSPRPHAVQDLMKMLFDR